MRSPEFDAELLFRTAAGWSRAELAARAGEPLPPKANEVFRGWIRERAARRPLQHLTGTVEFFGLNLVVGPGALVPRPDTETLVEAVLSRFAGSGSGLRIADVGCGAAPVALALAANLPSARVLASDLAAPALVLAAENARATGLAGRVRIVAGDLLTACRSGSLDAVAANLPYIPDADLARLEPEVRDHEPRNALAGGPDGLDPLRRLARMASRVLREGGALFVEIGAGQAGPAARILEAAGLRGVESRPDLAGIPRVLVAGKAEPESLARSVPPSFARGRTLPGRASRRVGARGTVSTS